MESMERLGFWTKKAAFNVADFFGLQDKTENGNESMTWKSLIAMSFYKNQGKRFVQNKTLFHSVFQLILAGLFSTTTTAQTPYQLRILPTDQDTFFIKKRISLQKAYADSNLVVKELEKTLLQLRNQAYLEASFDSVTLQGNLFKAWLHTGQPYEWARLENGNVEEEFLNGGGFRERVYNGKTFEISNILKLQERLLEQAENNGFPFASVRVDSVRFAVSKNLTGREENPAVSARIFMEKGSLVFFDSLNVEGDVKISTNYLRNYLGIKQGEPYSRKKVLKIRDRLRELPFLKEKKNVTVSFEEDQASLQLYLERKKASRFDFLLGLLPDNGRPERKLLITGTFNAEFQNQFGLGERIFVAFERLRPQTQRLEAAFAYPYMLDLPFGLDVKFNQYKRDSTYTDIAGEFGVQYLFEGGNYLKIFWNMITSNLISVDTNAIRNGRFPDHLDVRGNAFGLEANWQRLDYRFNPRKGWALLLNGSAGIRQIRQNQAILNVAESFYDTLPGRTFRFQLNGKAEGYLPLFQRSTVKLAAQSGVIVSEEPVYQNEQYRIGGNRLMRGFDEESIFATLFGIFTLEYRLLIGQNSWFYLFGDYGYMEDRRFNRPARFNRPLGFGGGMTFETTAGVFGISLAVGKQGNVPFDFRNPKVHFGYVSIF